MIETFRAALAFCLVAAAILAPPRLVADVPPGTEEGAKRYYRILSRTLQFSTPELISRTTLDDVASYLGYAGVTGADLQNLPPDVLMNTERLLAPNTLQNRESVIASLASVPFQPNDFLVIRF